jgi:hypothetical protein
MNNSYLEAIISLEGTCTKYRFDERHKTLLPILTDNEVEELPKMQEIKDPKIRKLEKKINELLKTNGDRNSTEYTKAITKIALRTIGQYHEKVKEQAEVELCRLDNKDLETLSGPDTAKGMFEKKGKELVVDLIKFKKYKGKLGDEVEQVLEAAEAFKLAERK